MEAAPILSSSNSSVRSRLVAIDPTFEDVLKSTLDRIDAFDPTIALFWETAGVREKVDTYCLRYVAVLYELYVKEEKELSRLPDVLAVQLLCCITWRLFDNCLDGHTEKSKAYFDSLVSFTHLYRFSESCMGTSPHAPLERHYRAMTNAAWQELEAPLPLSRIWERCAIFLFAIETVATLNPDSVTLYKDYINYSGLAHDAHDLYSDLASGIKSLPAHWIRELDEDRVFSERSVGRLYDRIRSEVTDLEQHFSSSDFEKSYPMQYSLLHDSREAFRRN